MKQNNHSFDSLNDRKLNSPGQPYSHAEFLSSRKEIILQRITNQKYKESKQNESPIKLQQYQESLSQSPGDQNINLEGSQEQRNSFIEQEVTDAQINQLKNIDIKKLQALILKNRNDANKSYSIQNFQSLFIEIGLLYNQNQQKEQEASERSIQYCEQLWRVIQFSSNSPFANSQFINQIMAILLNRQLCQESMITLVQNELINNFKVSTQQNAEEFIKQLNYSNINLKQILNYFYILIHTYELNEHILQNQASPTKNNNNTMNIYDKNKKNTRHEKLFQHAELLNQKRNTFSLLKQKEELDSCTFQPIINYNQQNLMSPKYQKILQTNVHDRLYQNAQEIKKSQEEIQQQREKQKEEEMQQYSFHPQITKLDHIDHCNQDKKNIIDYVPGAKTQLERLAKARRIKTEKDQFWDKQMQQYREKGVKTNPTKTQEFSFMNRIPLKREPIMYLDVNITTSKKGRIALYKGDDYKKVARDFAQIYRLNQEALQELEERVYQAIHIYYSQFA
ncbi:hypothetical protein TTHERM_00591620 (macronuclear) [Tetrahymena thermophila SB210]|uniref:Uncharacterized protein n=1 Tax=Tetrahymena thermophila (strain SB210) TaxID=312017 RepID=I7MKQ4_TETTS|nr:hypothetical protein TTHERM_00591620 [Tetrahymena thermophila SB210]EAR99726.1 hypothetical protein TTHERM_00591620 [Tetrahymena thermophila SB210]|eukprot:XP_001019971.1 hypothetical protein TTHERM_00591620 [Tetrahymena thermophila SB210]